MKHKIYHIWHILLFAVAAVDTRKRGKSQIFQSSVCVLCLLTALSSFNSYGQTQQPQTPQFGGFTPVTPGQNYNPQPNYNQPQQQRNPYGAALQPPNANQIMQQVNPHSSRRLPDDVMNDIKGSSGYYNPSAANGFNQMSPQARREKEMVEILRETQYSNSITTEKEYYNSELYKNDLTNYNKAKDIIKEMLNGKRALSIKDAFYFSEAAFGDLHLNYPEYNNTIKANTDFIGQWLKQNNYNLNDPEALHFGIQKFMSDTLFVTIDGKKQGHIPYYYDYIDAITGKDRRNYFVTKTIATGSGQCHTFPITYLILAEALGIEANLAYNPMHSFIRFKNNKGTVINYETTVDRFLPNSFYIETLPVMAEAQRNSLYVTELNKKQVVASVLFDLAVNFTKEHWLSDKTFINECIATAKPYFPNQGFINTANNYLHKRLYADDFNSKVQEKGIKDIKEIEKYPDVLQAYRRYYGYMESVSKLGIQDFPEAEYLRMLTYYDQKGKLQNAKNIYAKSKKSLFIN